jgi:sugar transferase (PEP-CTERM system associated)
MVRIFRQFIPIPFIVLGVVEILLAMAAVYLALEVWSRIWGGGPDSVLRFEPIWPKALVFTLVVFLAYVAMGLYQRRYRFAMAGMILRIVSAFLLSGVALALFYYIVPTVVFLGRGVLILSLMIAALMTIAARVVFVRSMDQEFLKRRILVLGAGEQAAQISRQMRRRSDQQNFTILGYVHVRGEHDVVEEYRVLRPDVTLLALAKELGADEIVVAVTERRRKSFPVHDLLDCKLSGVDVIDLQGFFERETGKLKLDILSPSWMIFSDGFDQGPSQHARKRVFDLFVSLVILLLAWPFMLGVALAIWIESGFKGSILYRQIRVGEHWRLFNVYKFRSMREDAEAGGAVQWASKNDDRITRVGRFIRKTRLDEFPQIFNVLKGDMSFVGPRPERPEFVTELSESIPYYAERHRVKPGITGWAQICYPYGASEKDSLEKLQFDLYYIKNYSLFLDLVIILQTAHAIFAGKGGR